MFRKKYTKLRSRKGFSLIELIVVIAIVGIMVMMAAPKFLGYTKDAEVATMKADAKILSDAAMLYGIDHDSAWPIGSEVVKSPELEAVIGDVTVHRINETALKTYVKGLKGDYADYGIITSGTREGDIVHLLGVDGKDEVVWYGTTFSADASGGGAGEPEEPEIYLATDADFSGNQNGMFRYIGTATELKIPHVIKGVSVTSYSGMFSPLYGATGVATKVVSDNPNIVTTMNMFNSSTATTLDLSDFDTSEVTNMQHMFSKSAATTIDISNFDTSKVTNMNGMFMSSKATTINVGNFVTSNVTDMSAMFDSSKVTMFDVSGFDTSNVTDMSSMFSSSQLTTIDVSNFVTSNVTDMSFMFRATKATTLDLSSFDTSLVTSMRYMFYNSAATTLDLSSFDTSLVTNMSHMFFGSQATTLDLSEFNTTEVTDMTNMFYNSQATLLDLSNFDISNVADIDWIFVSSLATTGYAKTQTEIDRFNASMGKPAGLNFVLKP